MLATGKRKQQLNTDNWPPPLSTQGAQALRSSRLLVSLSFPYLRRNESMFSSTVISIITHYLGYNQRSNNEFHNSKKKNDILSYIHSEIRQQSCAQETEKGVTRNVRPAWATVGWDPAFISLVCFVLWDRFFSVALAVPEFTVYTKPALDSKIQLPRPPTAGVKGKYHHNQLRPCF